jgi:16S rRNA (uracil1498-N3)-methyltransferase
MNWDKLQRLAIAPSELQSGKIVLTTQQQHYLGNVLRLRQGDRFIAMDGMGQWWLAKLGGTQAEILEPIRAQTELAISITLMVALPKGNGFDEVVRHCTELGVVAIMPVVSDRTLPKPNVQKLERWRRIAQEAAEQSERQIVPTILTPVPFRTGLSGGKQSHQYICVARGSYPHLLSCLPTTIPDADSGSIIIATGPEGGWTASEVEEAITAGFQPVSLGRRILRAVTAPVVALSVIAAALEDRSQNRR